MTRCPACHRPYTEERVGVRLPPLKAAIFDSIKANSELGITAAELMQEHYRGKPRKVSVIKSHVNQINDVLAETRWRIRVDYGLGPTRWNGDTPSGEKRVGRYLLVRQK